MGKRAKKYDGKKFEIDKLTRALEANGSAQREGPKRKKWTEHDIQAIKPMTATQEEMFHAWYNGFNICASGSAGTGKTFLALYLALQSILERGEQNRIIIVRSIVPTREVGFLPGNLEEKVEQYEIPYQDICHELVGRPSTYNDMKDAGVIEFIPTSFVRGLTWDNAVIIVDEAQNMSFHEIDSVITRIGQNTRVIVTGDTRQTDLIETKKGGPGSGMKILINVVKKMKEFSSMEFTVHDIVRSELVKAWIMATQDIDR